MRKRIALLLAISTIGYKPDILENITDQKNEEPEEIVSTSSIAEKNTQKNMKEELDENLSYGSNDKDIVYNVLFPAQTHAYLDPGNLSGRGQIFSDKYEIENYGNTDVAIKIKNIDVLCRSSQELYEFSDQEITDNRSYVKKMNVDMVWKQEDGTNSKILHVNSGSPDEYVIWLKAAECDENGEFVSLNKDSIGYFYFTGTLSSNPNIQWDDGELTVSFSYEIVNVCAEGKMPETNTQKNSAVNHDIKQTGTDSNADRDIQKD